MPNFFDSLILKKEKRRIIPVIFAVEASGGMRGERMAMINKALRAAISLFAEKNRLEDFCIKYAVLRFATGAQWLTEELADPAHVCAPDIAADGFADLGCAFDQINKKLSREEFFSPPDTYGLPFIFFITDGMPTDGYQSALNVLNENRWYRYATKIAIGIGHDVDWKVLQEITGNQELVVQLENAESLESRLSELFFLFLRLSRIGSCSMSRNSDFDRMDLQDAWSDDGFYLKSPSSSTEASFDSDSVCRSTEASFDSDSVCRSTEASFDSDEIATSCMMSEGDFDRNVKTEILSVWDDSDWFMPNDTNENTVTENERKLSEAACVFCTACGERMAAAFKFCPHCGTPVRSAKCRQIKLNQVQFSAVVPKQIVKGEYAMIDIAVYEETYRRIVDRIIANADGDVKEAIASAQEISENTMVRIVLSSPDLELTDCDETQKWQGRYLTYSFPVEIPNNYAKNKILFIASVYFNDLIATKLKFIVNCSSAREQKLQLLREDVLKAFISYASQDRDRVATIIQGMKKARPDMDIFFDVESLRSGENWENALRREIENRDILFLCWSQFAKESKWVETEWRYALANKGLDAIEPVPLVSPAECPPPDELKSKHFNDRALLYRDKN